MIMIRINIKQTVILSINIIKILNVEQNIHIIYVIIHWNLLEDSMIWHFIIQLILVIDISCSWLRAWMIFFRWVGPHWKALYFNVSCVHVLVHLSVSCVHVRMYLSAYMRAIQVYWNAIWIALYIYIYIYSPFYSLLKKTHLKYWL